MGGRARDRRRRPVAATGVAEARTNAPQWRLRKHWRAWLAPRPNAPTAEIRSLREITPCSRSSMVRARASPRSAVWISTTSTTSDEPFCSAARATKDRVVPFGCRLRGRWRRTWCGRGRYCGLARSRRPYRSEAPGTGALRRGAGQLEASDTPPARAHDAAGRAVFLGARGAGSVREPFTSSSRGPSPRVSARRCSVRTRSATPRRRTCSTAAPTCARSRRSSVTRAWDDADLHARLAERLREAYRLAHPRA